MSDPFIGEIRLFAGNFAPHDWALCDGRSLPVNQYQALFAVLGTIYGGDGKTIFKLPDLRGRVPVGMGTGPGLSKYVEGQYGGNEAVTLTTAQIPSHTHDFSLNGNSAAGNKTSPIGNYPATINDNNQQWGLSGYSDTSSGVMHGGTSTVTGGNQAHSNLQPYLSINFIIALNGIFPTRD